ncbi:beta-xylosidase [Bacteroidia bacterium]|nr:beta-xylosidase [Bacteroidia bacterium]
MKYKILFLCFVIGTSVFSQTVQPAYRNPVISGDFPDPSVIRVGEDYYAAGTSSEFAPNYPLYHSVDLINWEKTGFIFYETPEWIEGSCWAPELFYQNDTFYAYYTARKKSDHTSCIGVATTKDIRKGFTDRGILIEWGNEAIDAFVFRDTDNKLYITWKAYGLDPTRSIELLASELRPDGLALTGEVFSLTQHNNGWVGQGDEGECLVKHGNYYYLLYSVGGCCDNRCDYRVRVARSTSLKGTWEQLPGPILEGGGLWRCSGHGTLVTTPDNRYFYLYHAYNQYDFEFIGRQGLLDELLFDEVSGWPYFRDGKNPTAQTKVPFSNTVQKRNSVFFDDFSSEANRIYWQWDMKQPKPTVERTKDGLKLSGSPFVFLGTNPLAGNYVMETEFIPAEDAFKGLSVYGNAGNYFVWGIEGNEIRGYEVRNNETHAFHRSIFDKKPERIRLKIESSVGRLFRFYWSDDGKEWHSFQLPNKHYDGTFIPRWGAGIHVGLFLESHAGKTGTFSWFKLETNF